MRPSKLKKDARASVRMNSAIKKSLEKKGKTPQKIIDDFIDKRISIDKELNIKGA